MSLIQKSYRYQIYRNGTYLGDLPNVTSDFAYSQDINAAGSQCVVVCAISADTSNQPVNQITDESGDYLTDENGNYLWVDSNPPIVGSYSQSNLINNDNDIFIYEYSATYPNGKLMFSGYISDWTANFGGNDDDQITVTCLSNGTDLNNILVPGSDNLFEDQLQSTNNATTHLGQGSGYVEGIGNQFVVGAGITNVAAINVSLNTTNAPQTAACALYIGTPTGTLLGVAYLTISNTSPEVVQFIFPTPIAVSAGQTYCFVIYPGAPGASNYLVIGFDTSQGYAAGLIYLNYGGWGPDTQSLNFETFYSAYSTYNTFTSMDPTAILTSIMSTYISQGGSLAIPASGYPGTGIDTTYTFNVNSMLEGIQAVLSLVSANWYWYADIAQDILYFLPTLKSAKWNFTLGKHITSLQLKATIENLRNVVYFSGGPATTDGPNVFVQYTDQTSINKNNNRVGLDRISDTNVIDDSTGLLLAQNDTIGYNYEQYQTKVTILDQTMDITLPQVGDTVGFSGFGTFADSLVLQIIHKDYTPEQLTLTLGSIQPRVHTAIQQVKDYLLQLQQQNNPSSPTL